VFAGATPRSLASVVPAYTVALRLWRAAPMAFLSHAGDQERGGRCGDTEAGAAVRGGDWRCAAQHPARATLLILKTNDTYVRGPLAGARRWTTCSSPRGTRRRPSQRRGGKQAHAVDGGAQRRGRRSAGGPHRRLLLSLGLELGRRAVLSDAALGPFGWWRAAGAELWSRASLLFLFYFLYCRSSGNSSRGGGSARSADSRELR
jgi:hypothetical protein